MRSLFRYFVRNHVFYLFLILEIFSLILIFNYNNYQKVKYLNSTNRISASIYNSVNSVVGYFNLRAVNEQLAQENSELQNQLNNLKNAVGKDIDILKDTTLENQTFQYANARVINNTVYTPHNYITINKGSNDGIEPDQGIIADNKVVGVISNSSRFYAIGLSLLNRRLLISGKLKKNNQRGSINWDGRDYKFVQLNDIPFHVELAEGDTIVTSGFSSYFPEGVLIGTIYTFEQVKGENFYDISVKLAVDFKALSYVQVIRNLDVLEIKDLNNSIEGNEDMD